MYTDMTGHHTISHCHCNMTCGFAHGHQQAVSIHCTMPLLRFCLDSVHTWVCMNTWVCMCRTHFWQYYPAVTTLIRYNPSRQPSLTISVIFLPVSRHTYACADATGETSSSTTRFACRSHPDSASRCWSDYTLCAWHTPGAVDTRCFAGVSLP